MTALGKKKNRKETTTKTMQNKTLLTTALYGSDHICQLKVSYYINL